MSKNKFELIIKNFKTIKELKLCLNENKKNIIMLVGNNNSGKTNILDAIYKAKHSKIFFSSNDKVKYKYEGTSKFSPSLSLLIYFYEKKSIIPITIEINNKYHYSGIDLKYKENINSKINKKLKNLEKTNYKSSGAFVLGDNSTFAKDFKYNLFLQKIELSKLKKEEKKDIKKIAESIRELCLLNELDKNINIEKFTSINIFKYSLIDLSILDKESQELNNIEVEQKNLLDIWQKIMKADFNSILNDLSKFDNNSRDAKEYLDRFNINSNKLLKNISKKLNFDFNYIFKIQINNNKFCIDINLEKETSRDYIWDDNPENSGSGIKKLWSCLFWLSSIDEHKPTIILLDEIESNLNPIYQRLLSKWIYDEYKDRHNQYIIIVTHSQFMINNNFYENTYWIERNESNENETIINHIWDTKDKKNTPNLLLDVNNEVRYLESLYYDFHIKKYSTAIFVEGITDYNVISNICPNSFIVMLYGEQYSIIAAYHLPYLQTLSWEIKLLVDNDKIGNKIKSWFSKKTNIKEENIKTYYDFFGENNLEDSIINPWFKENKKSKTDNKKVNSIIFKEENKDFKKYKNLIKWIENK